MKHRLAKLLASGAITAMTLGSQAADRGLVDNSASPHAAIHSVGLDEVRWTSGFWADRLEMCRKQMLPALWSIMDGTERSQYLQNFRIAAGMAEGRHRGAAFNDGDFYKWLEGACALLAAGHDAELEKLIEEVIRIIAAAQRPDGYIHTPVLIRQRQGDADAKPFQDRTNFEMYNMGHLLTAACVHYRVTGQTSLLSVARKAADFLDRTFSDASPESARGSVCPSHYMGMVELYRTTRETRYLELARRFFALRSQIANGGDDNQDRIPFEQQTMAMGHAVRANYLYAGAADLFSETGAGSLWTPLELIWANVVRQKMYITGGCGALYDGASPDGSRDQKTITRTHQAYGRNYQLPNITAHGETCANIGNVLWNWRMFLATGEARFMDVLELALYNSVLSGVSLDGASFFYVNPLRNLDPLPTVLRWPRTRVTYLSSFCCPPNLFRTIAEAGNYAYGKSDNTVWINLYGGSTLSTRLPAGPSVKLTQETDYPWTGHVRLVIDEAGGDAFTLMLRRPDWARDATVRVNGALLGIKPAANGYIELSRAWKPGDTVDLDLPMPVRLMEANPLVEETLNQVALQRGPLVYCLESVDLPKGARLPDVMIPSSNNFLTRRVDGLLGGVTVLEGKGLLRASSQWLGRLYREYDRRPATSIAVRLIPYYAWANRGPSEMSVWLPLQQNK